MKSILIVEDNADIRLTVRLSLRSMGFGVHEAASAEDALPLLSNEVIDLVLLDVTLPQMSGWDLLSVMRSGAQDEPPVVMLTAHVGEEVTRQADELGATGVLSKPFEMDDLRRAVEAAIGVPEA